MACSRRFPSDRTSTLMRRESKRFFVPTTFLLGAALALSGCSGEDLGDCDVQAAREIVYGRNGLVATKGQALLHDSCGNAAFCHSANARRGNRYGAPADLNFDMLPPTGWPRVVEDRDDVWNAISDGDMPPGKRGRATLGNGDWSFDPNRSKRAETLPALSTSEGKAAIRNWLACGAPVVGETHVPSWAMPPASDDDAGAGEVTWTRVHEHVIKPHCALAGCHDSSGAQLAGMLDMSEPCSARAALLRKGPCGEVRVKPGDAKSLLLDKLESAKPRCNMTPMPPPLGGLPSDEVELVRDWVIGGAQAAECP
jgi:hypothetical protein